ncbi:hypothetical protein [Providencia manganoxydans]|uniref:hypothetical protein n=1 Tax=Providencia manganoxydans TaxID=2923283 RepID=UPI00280C7838|nr:hypothetical protein [Providencia stuartii]ELR5084317.1 hypothetical protein [Providencia stuartii]
MAISRIKYLLALKRIIIGFTLFSSFSFAETIDVGSVVREGFITQEFSLPDVNTSTSPPGHNCSSTSYGGCNKFDSILTLLDDNYVTGSGVYGIPLINMDSPSSSPTLYLVLVSGTFSAGLRGVNNTKDITQSSYPGVNYSVYFNTPVSYTIPATQKTSNLKYRIYSTGRAEPGRYSVYAKSQQNYDIIAFKSEGNAVHPTGSYTPNSRITNIAVPSFLVRPACTINNPAVVEWKNAAIKPVQGTTYGTKSTTLNYSCETGLNAISVFSKVSSGITDINKKKLFLNNAQTGPYITGSLKNTPPGCSGGDFLFDGETPFVGSNTGSLIMQWDLCSDGRPEAGKAYSGAIDVFILAK